MTRSATGTRVDSVTLSTGEAITCGQVANASDPRVSRTAEMAGRSNRANGIRGSLRRNNRSTASAIQRADIAVLSEMEALLDGADMVVHFGAIGDERDFKTLLGPNFIDAYKVWEAAHRKGLRRVVYASWIYAVGMHPKSKTIGVDVPYRPDTFYGLAKCFSEDLGPLTT